MLRERYWLVFILLQHDTSMFGLSGSPKLGPGLLSLANSGCWLAGARIVKRSLTCGGAPVCKTLLAHVTAFCPMEGHCRGCFIVFFLPQGQPRGHFSCIFFYHCVQRFKYNKKQRIIQSHYQAMPILELREKIRLRFVAEAQLEPAP